VQNTRLSMTDSHASFLLCSALIDACAKGGAGIGTCLKLFDRMEVRVDVTFLPVWPAVSFN
jgi:hypothetical protein